MRARYRRIVRGKHIVSLRAETACTAHGRRFAQQNSIQAAAIHALHQGTTFSGAEKVNGITGISLCELPPAGAGSAYKERLRRWPQGQLYPNGAKAGVFRML